MKSVHCDIRFKFPKTNKLKCGIHHRFCIETPQQTFFCTTINTANKFNKELFFKIYIFCSHQFINKIKLFGICAKSDRKINPNKLELLSFILNLPLTLDISLGFLSDFPKMMTTFRILFNSKEPGLC